jgi:hypothetical protein
MNLRRWFAVLLVNGLLLEAFAFAGLKLLERLRGIRYDPNPTALTAGQKTRLTAFVRQGQGVAMSQDPELGWVPYRESNSAGMRDDREYTKQPPPGALRIAAFGESFTYGSDVKLPESWTKQLAALHPSLELLNYGAPAYGTDQAWLRYRKTGAEYRPHLVFIGYMPENLARCVNVFRAFYSSMYRDAIFTKPRFRHANGHLDLIPNPVATIAAHERLLRNERQVLAELGRNDFHYQERYSEGPLDFSAVVRLGKMLWWRLGRYLVGEPIYAFDGAYNPRSEAYGLTLAILDAFYRDVLEHDALPVILVLPDAIDLERSRRKARPRYRGFLEHFRARGFRHIDLLEVLRANESRYSVSELTVAWGHFSPLGNKLVAADIHARLKTQGLLDPAAVRSAAGAERKRLAIPTGLR